MPVKKLVGFENIYSIEHHFYEPRIVFLEHFIYEPIIYYKSSPVSLYYALDERVVELKFQRKE